jgi:hypothetical protein
VAFRPPASHGASTDARDFEVGFAEREARLAFRDAALLAQEGYTDGTEPEPHPYVLLPLVAALDQIDAELTDAHAAHWEAQER